MEAGDDNRHHDAFPPTRWSLVLEVGDDDPVARATFCHAYWFPLYCYARRTGKGVEDAEDLTQAFFERMLARDFLGQANSGRGRLRTFLLRCFTNFMTEQWRRDSAQKRGAGKPALAIDALSAEQRLALEPHDTTTPELEFERAWARELLRQAVDRLEASYQAAGNGAVFHALRDQLADGSGELGYDGVAAGLGISVPAARFAAFKLRQRYRQTLRDLIRDTVADLDEVEAEVAHLRALF